LEKSQCGVFNFHIPLGFYYISILLGCGSAHYYSKMKFFQLRPKSKKTLKIATGSVAASAPSPLAFRKTPFLEVHMDEERNMYYISDNEKVFVDPALFKARRVNHKVDF
jgi:hypothetical protein